MIHVSTSEDANKIASSTDSTTSNISATETTSGTPIVTTAGAFEGEMTTDKIMAAIAFLQKAQIANAIKGMTTNEKKLVRSVTETLSDQAHQIILEECEKNATTEALVGKILDETVLSITMEDYYEQRDKEKTNKRDTNVVEKPLEAQRSDALR